MANPRLPDEIKRQRGTYRADRSNPDAPEPVEGVPEPPEDMDDAELAAFWTLVEAAQSMGVCDPRHHHAMTLFARAYAQSERLYRYVRDHGVTDEDGKKRPETAVLDSTRRECRMLLAEFGLTPSKMGNVAAKKAPKEDKKAKWSGFDVPNTTN